MSWYEWREYVPVAARRRRAQRELKKLKTKGQSAAPVTIEGRTIAKSFWGKSWCTNLERYSDYANRLPRGRTYVRNGSVVDLQIAKGEVLAFVSGSDLYKIKIGIAPVKAGHWKGICRDCAGSVDSLVELLQGRLAKGVMDRVCREGDGLFPSPDDIKLSCSCPDWADMCKHVAAVLYGVGARLDHEPRLLFVLRGVDEQDLIASAAEDVSLTKGTPATAQVLDEGDVAALFGLDMAEAADPGIAVATQAKSTKIRQASNPTAQTQKTAASQKSGPRATADRPSAKAATRPDELRGATKRRAQPLQ
jgi:uncharacterized Zn finger protein